MPIYSAGADGGNRLGRPGSGKIPTIVPVDSKNLACLAVGWCHNVVIFQDGSAVCWGNNTYFQLGMSVIGEFSRPVRLDAFPNEQLAWAHCGDKSTTFLTQSGKVYTCGQSTSRRILEIQIPKPAIYVTSGCAVSVAIDEDGAIYRANAGNTSAQRWELPDPVCDAAVGDNFILALTTQGEVFCLGMFAMEDTGSPNTFLPVPSLANIQVSRVFAYKAHAAVITRDGRVMMCGNGEGGRLGLGDTDNRSKFEFLTDLDGANITEIDMGDESTIFVGYDGSVYGCGASKDGRLMCGESTDLYIPTKSMHVPGKAVFVRCGCFHTVVVTDTLRPVHPGLRHFNMTGNLVAIARSILVNKEPVNTSAGSLTMPNLMPGDIINSTDYGMGRAVGILQTGIVCEFNGVLREVSRESITFKTREGFKGVEGVTGNNENVIFDGGHLCELFGFTGGSTVIGPDDKQFTVLGYAHGTIWFSDETGRALCLKEDDFSNLHSTFRYKDVPNIGYFDTQEGNVPIHIVPEYYVRYKNTVCCVRGTFGNMLFGKQTNGDVKLMPKQKCHPLQYNEVFFELDRVRYNKDNKCGTIIGCMKGTVIFISDDNANSLKEPIVVANSEVTLLSRLAGRGTATINGEDYEVGIKTFKDNVYPTDIYQTKSRGLVEIIGMQKGKIYAQTIETKEVYQFDKSESLLIRRHFRVGEYMTKLSTDTDTLSHVSTCISSVGGCGFLQGDEIELCGRKYIVCGVADHYFWFADLETHQFVGVAKQQLRLNGPVTVVQRPSRNTSIFCL